MHAAVFAGTRVLTVVFACLLVHAPLPGIGGFGLTAGGVAVVRYGRRLATLKFRGLVTGPVLVLPLAAMLGPAAAAHPAAWRLFASRLLLLLTAAASVTALLLSTLVSSVDDALGWSSSLGFAPTMWVLCGPALAILAASLNGAGASGAAGDRERRFIAEAAPTETD